MSEVDAKALPVPVAPRRRIHPRGGQPKAAFLSQLIAERYRLDPQRERRQAPLVEALRRYDAGEHIDDRRMPAGYRMTLDA